MPRPAGRRAAGHHVIKPGPVAEGAVLWEPTPEVRARAALTRYLEWLRTARGLAFESYEALWQWSVRDLDAICFHA